MTTTQCSFCVNDAISIMSDISVRESVSEQSWRVKMEAAHCKRVQLYIITLTVTYKFGGM